MDYKELLYLYLPSDLVNLIDDYIPIFPIMVNTKNKIRDIIKKYLHHKHHLLRLKTNLNSLDTQYSCTIKYPTGKHDRCSICNIIIKNVKFLLHYIIGYHHNGFMLRRSDSLVITDAFCEEHAVCYILICGKCKSLCSPSYIKWSFGKYSFNDSSLFTKEEEYYITNIYNSLKIE